MLRLAPPHKTKCSVFTCLQGNRRACGTLEAVPSRVRYRLGGLALAEFSLDRLAFPMNPRLKVLRDPCQFLVHACNYVFNWKPRELPGWGAIKRLAAS